MMERPRIRMFAISVATAVVMTALLLTPALTQIMQKDIEWRPGVELAEPRIIVRKNARTLELYDGKRLLKTYTVVLGFAAVGDKEKEGDGKTPEGDFYVFTRNSQSKFHLSLGLSYPSISDAKRGLRDGTITPKEHDAIVSAIEKKEMPPQNTALGGEIYIHGGGT